MADIQSKLDTIRTAERGEQVRDAIIGALRDINNDVPADMSNPEELTFEPESGSDYSEAYNPPRLVSRVTIHQAGSGGKRTTAVEATITENGTYPDPEKSDGAGDYDPDEEKRYYKKVKVNVPTLANAVMDLEEEITQNGTYSAFDWGVDGLRSFVVNVNSAPVSGTFEVEFYDKVQTDPTAAVKETQLVPAYGSAQTSYQPTSPTGQTFAGWNPDPINVTRNMKCYPRFIDRSIVPGEILDDWVIICEKGGEGYPLGSYKNMPFSYTWRLEDMLKVIPNWDAGHPSIDTYPDAEMTLTTDFIMYKVAVGEQGTKSTWLSRPTSTFLSSNVGSGEYTLINSVWGGYPSYNGSPMDGFLELIMFQSMADCFKRHIQGVNKYYQNLPDQRTSPPYNQSSINRHLWIPSIKEIMTTGTIEGSVNDTNLYIPYTSDNFEKNKEIFYDHVPSGISYFRDILGLSSSDFDTLMMSSGIRFSLRDSYVRDTGHTGWFQPGRQGNGLIVSDNYRQGYHLDGNIMLGFCLV